MSAHKVGTVCIRTFHKTFQLPHSYDRCHKLSKIVESNVTEIIFEFESGKLKQGHQQIPLTKASACDLDQKRPSREERNFAVKLC